MIGRPYAVLFFFGRQSLVIAAIGFAARLRCGARELSPLLRASAMLALLWCTGVLMVASDTLDPYSDHATLLVLLHVLGYGVLVPPLLARHVLALFTSLLGFGLALQRRFPSPGQPLWPALVHGVVVNCVGFSLAYLSEAHCRDNFARLQRLGEEERVKVSLRDSVHRLLLNTLPAPIVRHIAAGATDLAHRYGEVTVLQADLSGFTKLSSERSAAFVIGLLSDLFAKFDRLTEWHGVHKVKTIGDAYVVCCGAFDEAPTAAEAARRVVGMGLSMLDEVELCKREHGVDIAIRVGVHTGPAIGGIIGTVRFHFDLWGAAIAGAASLEEQGAAAKVYVSSS